MSVPSRLQQISEILQTADIPMVIWGDSAMKHHGIPTMILRDYILVPDQMLDTTTSLLFKHGYKTPSVRLPGQWGIGHKALADACRRFEYPDSYGVGSQELIVIPTSFVGLDSHLTLPEPEISPIAENIYCPSAHLLAISIIRVRIRSGKSYSLKSLMDAWASYFYTYCGFNIDSLNDAEQAVQDEWHRIGSEMGRNDGK